jgi:selenocysteine lyase/cysteine desulfurase
MLGLDCEDIALVSNASEAMNLVALALDLQAGDNVVVNDFEYPSVVLPWLRLAERGVEVRVAHRQGWTMPTASITDLIDASTKAVALSHVSYVTGWRHDIAPISAAAEHAGALFILDATQSFGVVPVPARLADVTISSSYKWLLGGHGLGVLAWNRKRRPLPAPRHVGWRSVADLFSPDRFERYTLYSDARRFEVGFPSYPSIYLLDASTAWLRRFEPEEVCGHVLSLSGQLVEKLAGRGFEVMTPLEPEARAGNVSISCEHGEEMALKLASEGIDCWGGDGRLRASVHLFNSSDDVTAFLQALAHLGPAERC